MRHHNQFREVSESEIGRPHYRLANPVYAASQAINGVVGGIFEITKWKYWDIYSAAVHTTPILQFLFTMGSGGVYTPIGGAAFNKQNLQCNLPGNGGQLVNPDYFLVMALGQRLTATIWPPDADILLSQTYVELQIGDSWKPYFQGVLSDVGGGSAKYISGTAPAAAAGQWAVSAGWPTQQNKLPLNTELHGSDGNPDLGVTIAQGQNFRVMMDPTQFPGGATQLAASGSPGGVGFTTLIELIGALARTVQ